MTADAPYDFPYEPSIAISSPQTKQAYWNTAIGLQRVDNLVPSKYLRELVSRVWQVHPFWEGNTRTIAVFAVLYLRSLGLDANNEPFERHARYFRDALVRANYRNAKAGVMPDRIYLIRFFENMINDKQYELCSEDLKVQSLFDDPSLRRNV